MSVKINDFYIVSIRSIGSGGEGVGTYEGLVCFVEGALPGEEVRVKVTSVKPKYFKADLMEVLKASPDRVKPICPVFERCGGCQLMHLNYEAQLRYKTEQVAETLKRVGGLQGLTVNPCIPSPQELHYRNKVQLPIVYRPDGWVMGLYARGSHDIIPVKKCYIHCEAGEQIFYAASEILMKMAPPKEGTLRHLLMRTAIHNNEILVVLVTTGIEKTWLDSFAAQLMEKRQEVKGVIENINKRNDNVILGTHYRVIRGVSTIEEKICDLRFRLSPHAFFQVNTLQVEQLYRSAIEMAQLSGSEVVVDAYCGVGTMALIAAGSCKSVIGIEYIEDAIKDARYNAQLNGIKNAEFFVGAAESLLHSIKKMDVVILNPPRKGCDDKVLQTLLKKAPRCIIYVSCNPATLARDLSLLMSRYQIDSVQPFDMFPQTSHVETVVKLYTSG